MRIIILAGGAGTRLWPLSRTYYPKQFLKLKNTVKSVFQMAFERCLKLAEASDIYIVTNVDYKFLVHGQIEELGYRLKEDQILIEPVGRDTLPAIYYAVKEIRRHGEDIVAVFPSDHLITDEPRCIDTVRLGQTMAGEYLVVFGICPTQPHTGYGYIKPAKPLSAGYKVAEFKEKPDEKTAQIYIEQGCYWNSGMFIFRTDLFVEELKKYCREVYEAFDSGSIEECFAKTPAISIDYGIMEKSDRAAVIPLDVKWSDLGSFDAFYEEYTADEQGNIKFERDILIDSSNNMLYSESGKAVALIGVEDLIVVEEKDALLICRKDRSQKVKDVVNLLKEAKDPRADYHMTIYRPWGSYTLLEESKFYKIRRISVLPGKKISCQLHHHRSEHWIVVKGTAHVTIEGQEKLILTGESTFVKSGHRHRLANPGRVVLEVIEVQLGEYLKEDDIVRFEY